MSTQHAAFGFETYRHKYRRIRLTRTDGIIEVRLHTGDDSLKWDSVVHTELGHCFTDIANDIDNKVVIITGEGASFCAEPDVASFGAMTAENWPAMHYEGKRLLTSLLDIDVPVIGAVNGPALIHAELAVLSNIVIAAESATFQDATHFTFNVVPGDGVHVVWPALLGPTRGSYFLLTGEVLTAQQALSLGVVNEVVRRDELMPRAWALAEGLARRPPMVRRHARMLLTREMRRLMREQLSHGLALEGLAFFEHQPG